MSRTLLARALGRGPSILLGASLLGGGTASLPTVIDVLDPRCFDFSDQLKGRAKRIGEANSPTGGPVSGTPSQRNLDSRIGIAVGAAAMSNPCYDGITSYGGFWGWTGAQDGKTKVTRADKGEKFQDLMGCGEETLKKMWPILVKWWKDGSLWDKIQPKCNNYDCSEAEWKTGGWSKFYEFFMDFWENLDEAEQEKMKTLGGPDYKWEPEWFTWKGMFDKVAVKVELNVSDGDGRVGWSKCSSVTQKR